MHCYVQSPYYNLVSWRLACQLARVKSHGKRGDASPALHNQEISVSKLLANSTFTGTSRPSIGSVSLTVGAPSPKLGAITYLYGQDGSCTSKWESCIVRLVTLRFPSQTEQLRPPPPPGSFSSPLSRTNGSLLFRPLRASGALRDQFTTSTAAFSMAACS